MGNFYNPPQDGKGIKYTEANYSDLLANVNGQSVGDLAEAISPQGTWLLGTLKPEGFYRWDGSSWVYKGKTLQDAISSNDSDIESNDTDITALQNEQTTQNSELVRLENDKLDKGNYIGNAEDLDNKIDKLTSTYWIESELPLMNQQSAPTYEPYFVRESLPNVDNTGTWSIICPHDGFYEVELNYRFSLNNTTSNFEAHLLLDGSLFSMPLHIESKDAGGTGILVPTVVNNVVQNNNINTGTDQFIKASGKRIIEKLSGETLSLRLEFAGQLANQEATIYNSSMVVRYVENSNIQSTPPSIGTATISYSSFPTGFTSDITITNNSGSAITSWTVIVSGVNWDVTNAFTSIATDLGNDTWMFQNQSYNGTIQDGQSITTGFSGTTGETPTPQQPNQNPINGQITVSE